MDTLTWIRLHARTSRLVHGNISSPTFTSNFHYNLSHFSPEATNGNGIREFTWQCTYKSQIYKGRKVWDHLISFNILQPSQYVGCDAEHVEESPNVLGEMKYIALWGDIANTLHTDLWTRVVLLRNEAGTVVALPKLCNANTIKWVLKVSGKDIRFDTHSYQLI